MGDRDNWDWIGRSREAVELGPGTTNRQPSPQTPLPARLRQALGVLSQDQSGAGGV